MVTVLTTCSILLGKRREFEDIFQKIKNLYTREGAELIGFWWTLGGDANEAVWIFKWKTFTSYKEGKKAVTEDSNYPIDEMTTVIVSYNEKILEE
jgi:hypothetical protein